MDKDEAPKGELIPAGVVARILGVKARTITDWLRKGKITGTQIGERWYVHRSSFNAIRDPEKAK